MGVGRWAEEDQESTARPAAAGVISSSGSGSSSGSSRPSRWCGSRGSSRSGSGRTSMSSMSCRSRRRCRRRRRRRRRSRSRSRIRSRRSSGRSRSRSSTLGSSPAGGRTWSGAKRPSAGIFRVKCEGSVSGGMAEAAASGRIGQTAVGLAPCRVLVAPIIWRASRRRAAGFVDGRQPNSGLPSPRRVSAPACETSRATRCFQNSLRSLSVISLSVIVDGRRAGGRAGGRRAAQPRGLTLTLTLSWGT